MPPFLGNGRHTFKIEDLFWNEKEDSIIMPSNETIELMVMSLRLFPNWTVNKYSSDLIGILRAFQNILSDEEPTKAEIDDLCEQINFDSTDYPDIDSTQIRKLHDYLANHPEQIVHIGYAKYQTNDKRDMTVAVIRYHRTLNDFIIEQTDVRLADGFDPGFITEEKFESGIIWTHHRRGTNYGIRLIATDKETGKSFVIYSQCDAPIVTWARETSQFLDGRFNPISPTHFQPHI